MTFAEYQEKALQTDIVARGDAGIMVPLLGLATEVGELLSVYKMHLWKGEANVISSRRISEELGDLLWYLSNTATRFGLSLNDIASANLHKCNDRWTSNQIERQTALSFAFDSGFPENERLPRQMDVEIRDRSDSGRKKVELIVNGEKAGDHLTDNSHVSDGYRFHDVFHLAYVAVLGWSPVLRSNLRRKRKSIPRVDEVEDGGRAIVIEEGISALVFYYASEPNWLEGLTKLDGELIKLIQGMTYHLEVAQCSKADWERAILKGYEVWRAIRNSGGGRMILDMDKQEISVALTAINT
jgi:NTP pyrophosphatase (non-canonical NTP hydrolase)